MAWTDHIAGSFGFGTAPFAKYEIDEEIARTAIAAAQSEGVTREEFARHIADYPGKYIKSEQVLRERVRADAAKLEKKLDHRSKRVPVLLLFLAIAIAFGGWRLYALL